MLSLFTLNAFASHLLLEKHAVSGLIIPEMSFKNDCTISGKGIVKIMKRSGDGTTLNLARQLSWGTVFHIRQLLRVARHASIRDGGILCDAGSVSVTGYLGGQAIMIKDQRDCDSYKYRAGRSARRIRNMATEICTF